MALRTSFDPVGDIFGTDTSAKEKSSTITEEPTSRVEKQNSNVVTKSAAETREPNIETTELKENNIEKEQSTELPAENSQKPITDTNEQVETAKPVEVETSVIKEDTVETSTAQETNVPDVTPVVKGSHIPKEQVRFLSRKAMQMGVSRDHLLAEILENQYKSNEDKTDEEIDAIIDEYEFLLKTNERITYRLPHYLSDFLNAKAREYGMRIGALLSAYVKEYRDSL